MSKSIGGILVRYPNQENIGNENKINNYHNSPNLPSLDDNQALSINNINPNPMTLAQGVRNANQTEFIDYDLDMQIKNLQTLMPNNPALQQQYSATLTKVLASRINAQAGITDPLQSQGQTNPLNTIKQWGNDFADATEAGVVGYATGASLGNFDEAMGGATTAFGVDYKRARDAVRQLQNNLTQQHPYIYKGMEMIGAATTPMQLLRGTSRGVQSANALTDTINASVGYAENWNDFVTNMLINGVANGVGLYYHKLPGGRALGNFGRNFLSQSIGQVINYFNDNLKNIFYNKDK